MSDHDIDRIRIARDANLASLRAWVTWHHVARQPITVEFCAGDFCVVCS